MHQYILIKNLIDKHKKKLRSSRPGVLRKKDTSKFLANPTEKHSLSKQCQNFIQKGTPSQAPKNTHPPPPPFSSPRTSLDNSFSYLRHVII